MGYHKTLIFASASEAHSKNLHRFCNLWQVWRREAMGGLPVLDSDKTTIFQWIADESAIFTNAADGWRAQHVGASFLVGTQGAADEAEGQLRDVHELCEEAIRTGEAAYALAPIAYLGKHCFVEKLACPFKTSEGMPAVICVMAQLFSYEASVDRALNAVSEGVVYLFPIRDHGGDVSDLIIGYINEKAASKVEKPVAEMTGHSIRSFFPDFDSKQIYRGILHAIQTGQPEITEVKFAVQGTLRNFRINMVPMPPGCMLTLTDITLDRAREEALKDAHAALQTQHDVYRTLVDANPDIICRYKPDGTMLFVNQAYASLKGMEREKIMGQKVYDLIDPDRHETMREHIASVCQGEGFIQYEQTQQIEGRPRRFYWSEFVIRDAQGKMEEVQAIGRDITSLHARLVALRRLNGLSVSTKQKMAQQLEQVLTIGLDLFQMDNGLIARCSGKDIEVLYSIGNSVSPPGTSMPLVDTVCYHLITGGVALKMANRQEAHKLGISENQSPGYQSFIGAPVFVKGEVYGSINFKSKSPRTDLGSEEDLAFVKLLASFVSMTIERRQQSEALRVRHEHFRRLFREAPVMMHTIDSEGQIVTVSDAWLRQMGYPVGEAIGRQIDDFICGRIIPQDFATRAEPGKPCEMWDGKTFFWRRSDGTRFEGEVSAIYFDDPLSGEVLSLWVVNDVSQRNEAMRLAQANNHALSEANERLKAFAYIASHDLQEPLRKMRAFCGHLRSELKDALTEEANFSLDAIERAAHRLSILISDLLTYSRESEKEHNLQAVDLDGVLETILQDLSLQIKEAGMTVVKNTRLGEVMADHGAVRHLIQNFVHNAIKYRDFGRAPRLVIDRREGEDASEIIFRDNGIGFDQKWAEKIFQPFQRLHGKSDRPGSGIGLAICKTVADRHGWKLSAESMPGEGAVFTTSIPK